MWKQKPVIMTLDQYFGKKKHQSFLEKMVILSEDKKLLFNVVSSRYKLLEHTTVINTAVKACMEVFGTDYIEPKVEWERNGARIFCTIDMPQDTDILVSRHDLVKLKIIIINSYDSSYKFTVRLGAYRVACSNGMILGDEVGLISAKHFKGSLTEEVLTKGIKLLVEQSKGFSKVLKEMREAQFKESNVLAILDHYPKRMQKELLFSTAVNDVTMWEVYNEITSYISTKVDTLSKQYDLGVLTGKLFIDPLLENKDD